MKLKTNASIIGLLILISIIMATINCTQPSAGMQNQLNPNADITAKYEVGPIMVSPRWLFVGDNATVSAKVTNTGGTSGTYTAILTVDGDKIDEKDVYIVDNTTVNVSFTLSSSKPGTRSISIGDSKSSVDFVQGVPYEVRYDNYGEIYLSISGEEKVNFGSAAIVFEPYGQMVRFTVPAKPFRINKITVIGEAHLQKESDKQRQFTINIRDIYGKKLWTGDFPWTLFSVFSQPCEINVPNIRVDDDFYIEFISHTPRLASSRPADDFIYPDSDTFLGILHGINDYETRSTSSNQGKPIKQKPISGIYREYSIRLEGEGGPTQVLYYDDALTDTYNVATDYSYQVDFTPPSKPFDLNLIQFYGYRDIADAGSKNLMVKVIDKATNQVIWQREMPWKEIQYGAGIWNDINIEGVTCNHDFTIELNTNSQPSAAIWIGCDTTGKNRNSQMANGGYPIEWRKWSDTKEEETKTFAQDYTKWMVRVAGIAH